MSRHLSRVAGLAVAAFVLAGAAWAQTITGRISGTVYDTSRSVLPGVTVTVTETRTGFTQNAVSDANGVFVFVSLPLGDYTVAAELEGFKKAVKSGFVLGADERLTADFLLEVGTFAETVEVSVAAETVNTTSGELSRKVDQAQVQNLALNGRNYLQLTTLIPGVPLLNDSALDIMTGLGINTSINGSRQNANLLTVDGGFNMDSGSNNSQISNVGIDLIEEVSIKTASFSAEYGRNSGAAINIVTRGGSNRLRGSGFYYMRDESLDANEFFNNARKVEKPDLSYKNYGGTVGGPIIRDKLFFFGGLEWRSIDRFTSPTLRTLPNSAMRSGNFSHLTTTLRDPVTGLPFPGNVIPADRITADGRAIANVYAAMAEAASSYTDTPTSNNSLFQDPNPFDFRQESIRLDYVPSIAHRLTGRLIFDHYKLIAPYGTFIDSQLPTIPTERNRPGQNVQVNHFWTVRPNLVNEAKFNYSGNGQKIPPVGDAWKRDTYGFQFAQLYSGGGEYENSIPNVDISGIATFRGANGSLMSPTKDFSFSDTVTWVKGSHTLKGGGLIIRNNKDQNGRSEYPGFVNFATSGNTRTTGNAFADALLGNFRTYREAQLDPIGYYRFWQTEAFVSDQWRVSNNLSVEAGIRYYYYTPTYLLGNNATSFDPSAYSAAQAVTMNTNGTIVPGTGNRFNGLVRPGDVPSDQTDNVPNAGSPFVQAIPIAENRGFFPSAHLFAPRVSASWSPGASASTAVRGGIGLFYDHSEGNLYFPLANNPPFSLSSEYQNGNLANPGGGTAAPLAPWGSIDSLDPDLKWPRQWNWSVGVQQQLPWWSLFAEVAYVGADGQNLLRQPDINQPSFEDLSANAPPGPNYSTNYLRPYKGYSNIRMRLTDADSSYNALQLNVGRRRGDLTFTVNYTYAKAYDNASGNTDDPEDYQNKDYNWGPANHDRTHVFVTTWTYNIPFLRDSKSLAGYVLGGWQISGITRAQSGAPLTITGSTSIGTRRADYLGGEVYYPDDERFSATGAPQWLRPEAFAAAPEGRRGNTERGAYRGPGLHVWDMSLRKQFPLSGSVRATIQADAFNIWNHTNLRFSSQSLSRTTAGFGQLNAAAPPRQVQLGFRLTF